MAEILARIKILNFLTTALETFIGAIGTENINIATDIFMPLTSIMIIIFGISIALGKAEVSDTFYRCVMIATYFYFIQNYTFITSSLLDFFSTAGLTIGGSSLTANFLYDPSGILIKGFLTAWDVLIPDDFWDLFKAMDNLYRLVVYFCVWFCFGFIAVSDFLFVIEYHLITTLLIIIFPFGILNIFSFLSESVISTLFRLNIKLMTFCFVVSLSLNLLEEEIVDQLSNNPSLEECLVCTVCTYAICYVVWKVPNLASTVITGNPSLNAQGIYKETFSMATRLVSIAASRGASMLKK